MKKLRSQIFFKSVVLLFFTTYLFYALTNIFSTPGHLNQVTSAAIFSGVSHRRNELSNGGQARIFIRLADKCFLDENQLNSLKFTGILLVTIFTFLLVDARRRSSWPVARLFYNKQHSYLALRALRI
jgi:hypothetical protein